MSERSKRHLHAGTLGSLHLAWPNSFPQPDKRCLGPRAPTNSISMYLHMQTCHERSIFSHTSFNHFPILSLEHFLSDTVQPKRDHAHTNTLPIYSLPFAPFHVFSLSRDHRNARTGLLVHLLGVLHRPRAAPAALPEGSDESEERSERGRRRFGPKSLSFAVVGLVGWFDSAFDM